MLADKELINEMEGLKKFAIKLCGNAADADDLLQATMEKALVYREKFETGSRAFSWLSKIMFNDFVSGYKRKVRFETKLDPEPIIMEQRVASTQEDKLMVREVSEAMRHLSPEHQEILTLVCAYEMSYEEVAAQLGVPVGTVRSRLSRARETLQTSLARNDNARPAGRYSQYRSVYAFG